MIGMPDIPRIVHMLLSSLPYADKGAFVKPEWRTGYDNSDGTSITRQYTHYLHGSIEFLKISARPISVQVDLPDDTPLRPMTSQEAQQYPKKRQFNRTFAPIVTKPNDYDLTTASLDLLVIEYRNEKYKDTILSGFDKELWLRCVGQKISHHVDHERGIGIVSKSQCTSGVFVEHVARTYNTGKYASFLLWASIRTLHPKTEHDYFNNVIITERTIERIAQTH